MTFIQNLARTIHGNMLFDPSKTRSNIITSLSDNNMFIPQPQTDVGLTHITLTDAGNYSIQIEAFGSGFHHFHYSYNLYGQTPTNVITYNNPTTFSPGNFGVYAVTAYAVDASHNQLGNVVSSTINVAQIINSSFTTLVNFPFQISAYHYNSYFNAWYYEAGLRFDDPDNPQFVVSFSADASIIFNTYSTNQDISPFELKGDGSNIYAQALDAGGNKVGYIHSLQSVVFPSSVTGYYSGSVSTSGYDTSTGEAVATIPLITDGVTFYDVRVNSGGWTRIARTVNNIIDVRVPNEQTSTIEIKGGRGANNTPGSGTDTPISLTQNFSVNTPTLTSMTLTRDGSDPRIEISVSPTPYAFQVDIGSQSVTVYGSNSEIDVDAGYGVYTVTSQYKNVNGALLGDVLSQTIDLRSEITGFTLTEVQNGSGGYDVTVNVVGFCLDNGWTATFTDVQEQPAGGYVYYTLNGTGDLGIVNNIVPATYNVGVIGNTGYTAGQMGYVLASYATTNATTSIGYAWDFNVSSSLTDMHHGETLTTNGNITYNSTENAYQYPPNDDFCYLQYTMPTLTNAFFVQFKADVPTSETSPFTIGNNAVEFYKPQDDYWRIQIPGPNHLIRISALNPSNTSYGKFSFLFLVHSSTQHVMYYYADGVKQNFTIERGSVILYNGGIVFDTSFLNSNRSLRFGVNRKSESYASDTDTIGYVRNIYIELEQASGRAVTESLTTDTTLFT